MSKSAVAVAWRITKLNFRAQLEYRTEFFMMVAIGVVWQLSVIVFATVLLSRFAGMGGWAASDALLIAAMRMLSHGLFVLFFGRVHYLAHRVQEGVIDAALLRPMPVYRQVQLMFFPTNAIGDLIVGVGLFVGAMLRSTLHWTPGRTAFLVAGVLGGMLVEAALFTALSAASLHYPATSYWGTWLEELLGTFGSYPLSVLPTAVSGALTYVLPLAFIAYFPAGVLTGHGTELGVPVWVAAASPVFGLAAFIGARLLWNRSLRYYTGVNG
ncbi:ABC-2 family transporter protein [Streptomyces sp. MNU76]|uniref:ABC transporter permease n=1 Tax=Streptomyces sp. MNU76 TaxID=2560026 RepID=UPI001E5FF163|nr:ABC-2 family transporter protein [Streptomyces sp. MNU76]MCC9711777.1 ABC-2 family transporter protein [Streptomyces sp. MNU76]